MMLTIMIAILGTGFFYIGRKIFRILNVITPSYYGRIFISICVFYFLMIILAFLPFDINIKRKLVWLAWLFIGLFIYFLLSFLLSDIVLLAGKLFKLIPAPVPPKIIVRAGLCVLALVIIVISYGLYNGRQLKEAFYDIKIDKNESINDLKNSLKIVLIADTHLWYINDDKWLERIAEKINKMEPDIVCIAGDIFNDNFTAIKNPQACVRAFQSIKSKYGVYASFGNHDGGNTIDYMYHLLKAGNVRLLQDEYVIIDNKFILLGRSDSRPIGGGAPARKDTSVVLDEIYAEINDTSLPIIVMEHNPSNKILQEYENKVDLILAGHTHKGQMFPGNVFTHFIYDVDYGYYGNNKNSPHVIVTSGAGVWGPPLRIGTNNEVVSIKAEF